MGCKQSLPIVRNDSSATNSDMGKKLNSDAAAPKAGKIICCQKDSKTGFTYRKNTCALEYWEPIRLLGEGSISSIHLVRRRPERIAVPYKERADVMKSVNSKLSAGGAHQDDIDDSSSLYALKSIMKDHVRNDSYLEEMRSEIYTMSRLCHPNIVNVKEAFERKRHIYLVMEACWGGDLCERKSTEAEAAVIVRKVLSAVDYMHKHNVVHRDLKLENIMFDRKPSLPSAEIKIIDFGLATKFLSNDYKNMTDRVGTLYSMAPQVLQGVYDAKCDLWSIGVVTYMLLSENQQPFWGPPREMSWEKRRKIMIDRIMRCEYMRMTGPKWEHISPEAKSFVASLLQMDPSRRPTAEEALQMPWIVTYRDYAPNGMPPQNRQYAKKMQLKREAQVLMAQELPEGDILKLHAALKECDTKTEGRITIQQFHDALMQTNLSQSQVTLLFSDEDVDMNARMDYNSMLNEALNRKLRKREEQIVDSFRQSETEVSCKISKQRLRNILAAEVSLSTLDRIIDTVASGDDESLSCQEVLDHLKKLNMETIGTICSCEEDEDVGDECENLVDENNVVIPGGKNHSSERPKFIYDNVSKSVRKCCPDDDLSSSSCN